MKMNRILDIVSIVAIIGAVLYMILFNQERKTALKGDLNYTIGEITNYKIGTKSEVFIFYFKVNSKTYKGKFYVDNLFKKKYDYKMKSFIGKKFLVKYSVEKPKFNEIFIHEKIPDNLINCNNCVWKSRPF